MTFELNSLALEEQAALHLTHPATGYPLYADAKETKPVEIVLKGQASSAYRKAIDLMLKNDAKRGGKKATPEQARAEGIEFLVAISVEIKNLVLDGQPVADADAFRKLYGDERYGWVKTQINAFLSEDPAAFLK